MDVRGQRPRALANATRPEAEWETRCPGWVGSGTGRGARREQASDEEKKMRNREGETVGKFWGRETVHLRENQPRRVGVAEEEEKRGDQAVYRPWAGSVSEAGTGHVDGARKPEPVCERGQ